MATNLGRESLDLRAIVQGSALLLDMRTNTRAQVTASLDLHLRKINSVSFQSGSTLFATASTDTTVKVWDMRALGGSGTEAKPKSCKALAELSHGKACHGVLLLFVR